MVLVVPVLVVLVGMGLVVVGGFGDGGFGGAGGGGGGDEGQRQCSPIQEGLVQSFENDQLPGSLWSLPTK